MSVVAENDTNAFEQTVAEETSTNNDKVSSELIEQRIRENLEPLIEKIAKVT